VKETGKEAWLENHHKLPNPHQEEDIMHRGMIAENIHIYGHNNDKIESYISRPMGDGPFPGVILIHHLPGWDDGSKEMVRKFAFNNYIAISPNLHHREGPGENLEIMKKVIESGGLPDDQCLGDLEGAIRYLESLPAYNGKVGIIGFCSGGRQVYLAACNLPKINAAVDCYGGRVVAPPETLTKNQPVAPIDMTKNLHCPLLGLFGVNDKNPSPEDVAKMEEELKKYNKTYEFHSYENAGHAFFQTEWGMYRPEAATDGWKRVFAWYEKYLS
jgi:carboxymethylenebutenolidase